MKEEELKNELKTLNKLVSRANNILAVDTFNLIGTLSTIEECSERIRKQLFIEVLGPKKK